MQIDPKVAIGLNVVYTILTGISIPVLKSFGISDPEQIVAVAGALAVALNTIMHAFASSQPGPAAPADPPEVVAAQAEVNRKMKLGIYPKA